MNPALIVSIISSSLLALTTITAAWLGFRGARRAAAAQEKVGLVDAAIDGLNETVGTLRTELTITREEVGSLRAICRVLKRNEATMRSVISRKLPDEELDLEKVPNGFVL